MLQCLFVTDEWLVALGCVRFSFRGTSPEIGWEDHLRNGLLFYIGRVVKLVHSPCLCVQTACARTAHQDDWPPWSHCRRLKEEVVECRYMTVCQHVLTLVLTYCRWHPNTGRCLVFLLQSRENKILRLSGGFVCCTYIATLCNWFIIAYCYFIN